MMIALLLLLVQDDGAQYYKFKKDTSWVFQVSDDGKEGRLVFTVLEEKDGKVLVSSKEFKDPKSAEPSKTSTMAWYVEEGCYSWGKQSGDSLKTMWHIFKLDSKKDETWKALGKDGDVKNLGTEEITVPAGTYKDVVHTQITLGKQTFDFYLAPGVGLVKFGRTDGARRVSMELAERTEPK